MNKVALPNGRVTSRLGFGCGSIRGGSDEAASRALIVAALDAGIRHFDLAPSYGLGLAEDVAGRVLHPLMDEVTVTTKAGIGRPFGPGFLTALRSLVRPAMDLVPGLWGVVAQNVRLMASSRGRFEPEFVRRSLDDSLGRLCAERVDILLMHEMNAADVSPALLEALRELKACGVVGAMGTGGNPEDGIRIAEQAPELGEVRQFRWCVFEPPIERTRRTLYITHGAIGSTLKTVGTFLAARPDALRDWSSALDVDLGAPEVVANLLLAGALSENPEGIVLFSSRRPEHIRRAALVAGDEGLIAKGAKFHGLVRGAAIDGKSAPIRSGTVLQVQAGR